MKIIERRGGISVQLRRPQWTGVSLLFLALQTLENRLSARLIGDPDDRILCLGAAKQATDVLIQKANRELEDAQKDKRNREVLQGRRAIKSLPFYIISLADTTFAASEAMRRQEEAAVKAKENKPTMKPAITDEMRERRAALQMAKELNRQIEPRVPGV
ncbi:MAG: hypothetical protein MMC33_006387 [Icmadophila ericetorum]|nr:hypothetical protein [Icmadophila ericetorum]